MEQYLSIEGLTWKDFRDAVYKISAEERKDCCWFLNETVLNHIANIEDNEGRPIWRRPTEAMPGKLDLYPYHEVSILPQIADLKADETFMNPKRIQHGNCRALKLKSLTAQQRHEIRRAIPPLPQEGRLSCNNTEGEYRYFENQGMKENVISRPVLFPDGLLS